MKLQGYQPIYQEPFLLVSFLLPGVTPIQMDESALSSAIFDSLRKCIQLREKYTEVGLQRKQDNPRDYPNLAIAPATSSNLVPIKVHFIKCVLLLLFSTSMS